MYYVYYDKEYTCYVANPRIIGGWPDSKYLQAYSHIGTHERYCSHGLCVLQK